LRVEAVLKIFGSWHRSGPLSAMGLVVALGSGASLAAGFGLTEFSVRGMGSAYAGSTTSISDPAMVYWNPAGLVHLDGTQAAGNLFYAAVRSHFDDRGSSQSLLATRGPAAGSTFSRPSSGSDGGNIGGSVWLPSGYLTHKIDRRWAIGVGVFSPFGLQTEYSDGWKGRYHVRKSSLTTININPSLSYRFNQSWSFGVGVSAEYADVTLSQALFTGAADGEARVKGNDWAFGFNAGLLFEPVSGTRIGVAFRSKTRPAASVKRAILFFTPSRPYWRA